MHCLGKHKRLHLSMHHNHAISDASKIYQIKTQLISLQMDDILFSIYSTNNTSKRSSQSNNITHISLTQPIQKIQKDLRIPFK